MPELELRGHAARTGIERLARNKAGLTSTIALSFFAFTVMALPFATLTLAQLPAPDKAAFYRMRKQAIERRLQEWSQSPMPGRAKEMARLQKEVIELNMKLNPRMPGPSPGACSGCPAKDPDWCGLNCTMR